MSVYNVLYLLLVFSFALSAVAMWVNWLLNRHETAVRDWAIALSLILVGCGLAIIARLLLPEPYDMIEFSFPSFLRDFGTSINGLAWIVIWYGTLRFMGRPVPSKKYLIVFWVAFLGILLIAHPLKIPDAWNVGWISLLVSIISLMILYEIFRPGFSGVAAWFACAGFALAAITWGVRAIMSFVDIQRTIDTGFDTAVMFGAVISAYACMLGLVLLTNQRLIDRLGAATHRDALTSVPNKLAFIESLESMTQIVKQNEVNCTLVLMDMDNLSDINELYGQDSGDLALKQVAISSMQILGRQDLFARHKGSEFVFLLYGRSANQARMLMNKIQVLMQQNIIESDKGEFKIQLSMGVFEPDLDESFDKNLAMARRALNSSKTSGGSRVTVYDSSSDSNRVLMRTA